MKVEVRLFATLQSYLPPGARGDSISLEVPAGATVRDVVESLQIPSEVDCLTVVNGRDAAPDHVLSPGDELAMFPPLSGGAA
jgi:molybdopterin converting factor small subunit